MFAKHALEEVKVQGSRTIMYNTNATAHVPEDKERQATCTKCTTSLRRYMRNANARGTAERFDLQIAELDLSMS